MNAVLLSIMSLCEAPIFLKIEDLNESILQHLFKFNHKAETMLENNSPGVTITMLLFCNLQMGHLS